MAIKRTVAKPPKKAAQLAAKARAHYPYSDLKKDESFTVDGIDNYGNIKSLSGYWNKKFAGKRRFSTSLDREKNKVWVTRTK